MIYDPKKFHVFLTSADELMPFWEKIIVLHKAIGRELTREEKEYVFLQMKIGKEIDLKDLGPGEGKKILMISPKREEDAC